MLVRSLSMRLSFRRKRQEVTTTTITTPTSNASAAAVAAAEATTSTCAAIESDSEQQVCAAAAAVRTCASSSLEQTLEQPLRMLATLDEEYSVVKTLAEGSFAQVMLATHKQTKTTVVLKAVHAELTSSRDFMLEYQTSYKLSAHPSILTAYNVAFRTDNCFFFALELAPFGDLANFVKSGGLPESQCKAIVAQIASALEFVHGKMLVHRDIKLENVLVFDRDLKRVKLCDFGSARKNLSLVSKLRCVWMAFVPPELYVIIKQEKYSCQTANDVWQFAILVYFCLTGTAPWQHADYIKDTAYAAFWRYQKRRVTKVPIHFKRFSSRLLRMFRRMFEHKPHNRSKITEVNKYLKDSWLVTQSPSESTANNLPTPDPLTPGVYSGTAAANENPFDFNNNLYTVANDDCERNSKSYEQKVRMRRLLASYGLDTAAIDVKCQSERVQNWLNGCDFRHVSADLNELIDLQNGGQSGTAEPASS